MRRRALSSRNGYPPTNPVSSVRWNAFFVKPKAPTFNSADKEVPQRWRFTSALDVYGSPFWGKIGVYGGGGYIAAMPSSVKEAVRSSQELAEADWFDVDTRAVFIEFLLYNAGTNLYTVSFLIVEVFNGGGFVLNPSFYTLRMDRYYGEMFVIHAVLDGLSLFFIIYFIVREIMALRRMRCAYFSVSWGGKGGGDCPGLDLSRPLPCRTSGTASTPSSWCCASWRSPSMRCASLRRRRCNTTCRNTRRASLTSPTWSCGTK